MRPWRLAPRAALPVPSPCWRSKGRRPAGFSLAVRPAGHEKGKQTEDIADLKTCDQHGEFKKRAQQAVRDISGSDDNRGEDQCARRDENQNLEKPPENRPQQDAPNY
jgi:hypothetical protein